ncbi:hypothetical protein FIBSPDRAFT_80449 [Athelia psychrophila]|uniref:Uncharacterized protein n=1 Tax=Athelia psychrophila TaxID=1759441 RepID=A0A166E9E8_9AGAM|nr:hypothetical protein FIBSPDRAFT_80449 [Fibularhizoctonia sp. CBS 109695]
MEGGCLGDLRRSVWRRLASDERRQGLVTMRAGGLRIDILAMDRLISLVIFLGDKLTLCNSRRVGTPAVLGWVPLSLTLLKRPAGAKIVSFAALHSLNTRSPSGCLAYRIDLLWAVH